MTQLSQYFPQDRQSKEKSVSPQRSNKPKEATECNKDMEAVSKDFDPYDLFKLIQTLI